MSPLFPELSNWGPKAVDGHHDKKITNVYVQEKLDGCNFRVKSNCNGQISFGTRRLDLPEGKDFHGFIQIKELLVCFLSGLMEKIIQAPDDKFNQDDVVITVFGELIGVTQTGRPVIPRGDYGLKTIKFYAYEILVHKDAYCGSYDDLIEYNEYNFGESGFFFVNFKLAQELLKEAGFDVIPYEKVEIITDFCIDSIKLPPFKSLIFQHADENRIEGYIVRFETNVTDKGLCYKYKSKIYPEAFLEKSDRKKSGKNEHPLINKNTYIDFMSKFDYPYYLGEKILLEYADYLAGLERTKENFNTILRFVLQQIRDCFKETFDKFIVEKQTSEKTIKGKCENNGGKAHTIINVDSWQGFMSNNGYLNCLVENMLTDYADDLELERTKENLDVMRGVFLREQLVLPPETCESFLKGKSTAK